MDADAAERVQQIRRRLGLKQAAFADLLGVTSVTISRWESGRVQPSPLAWQRLQALDRNADRAGTIPSAAALLTVDTVSAAGSTDAGIGDVPDGMPEYPMALPRPLSTFIGRETALADLTVLALEHRLLVLTGVGGAGKTRLAIELARTLAPAFDGVIWVDLTALLNPDLLPQTVAVALGIREQGSHSLLRSIAATLGARHCLLVLDNCEHLIGACAALVGALMAACPNLHVVATSREILGVDGGVDWAVPPLELPPPTSDSVSNGSMPERTAATDAEAMRLFVDRARARERGFTLDAGNTPIVAGICRRLDGLPLAIELAAAWIPVLSPAEIAARLDDRFRLLIRSPRSLVPRHRTLRAALDWSFDLLTPAEQVLLVRLAVFVGDCSLASVQASVSDARLHPGSILALLGSLVDKSLVIADVRPRGTRYRLLETIRAYGWERLEAQGELATLRTRHAEACLRSASAIEQLLIESGDSDALDQLADDLGNFRAALQWFHQRHEHESYVLLVVVIDRLWKVRSQLSEGWAWLELSRPMRDGVTPDLRSQVLHAAAGYALQLGRLDDARALLEEALAIGRHIDHPLREGHALSSLGDIARMQGNVDEAQQLLRRGVAAMHLAAERTSAYAGQLGIALGILGLVEQQAGDSAAAAACFHEAISMLTAIGDQFTLAVVLCNQAVAAIMAGNPGQARVAAQQSSALFDAVQAPNGRAAAIGTLGLLALVERDDAAAFAACHEALTLFAEHNVFRRFPTMLQVLAVVASRRQQHRRALTLNAAANAMLPGIAGEFPFLHDLLVAATTRSHAALRTLSVAAAEAAGQAMSPLEAAAYALAGDDGDQSGSQAGSAPGCSDASIRAATHVADTAAAPPLQAAARLSRREREVLDLLAGGQSARQIADTLVLSVRTVERHIAGIYAKIGARGRADAIVYAYQHGARQSAAT